MEDPDGNVCKTTGPVPEPAVYRSLTQQDLEQQLKRPAARRTSVPACRTVLGPDLMLPASAINAMRRDVIAELTARRRPRRHAAAERLQ